MRHFFAILACATLLFSACQEKGQPPIAQAESAHAVKVTALARDDLGTAKEAFHSMHAVLHMMPKDGLDSLVSAHVDSSSARIMAILHRLAAAKSLGAARNHFMDFSLVLLDAIGKFGVSGTGPIYHFHCPMARDNKGADWLQKDSSLANPYYGTSMLKCGVLVRVLKG